MNLTDIMLFGNAINGGSDTVDEGFSIVWDGNTEGREVIELSTSIKLYKVTDEILTAEQMLGATASVRYGDEINHIVVTEEYLGTADNFTAAVNEVPFVISGKAGAAIEDDIAIPADGTYFLNYGNGVQWVELFFKAGSNSGGSSTGEVKCAVFNYEKLSEYETVTLDGQTYVKLSDEVPTYEQIIGGCYMYCIVTDWSDGSKIINSYAYAKEDMTEVADLDEATGLVVVGNYIFVAPHVFEDVFGLSGVLLVLPEENDVQRQVIHTAALVWGG